MEVDNQKIKLDDVALTAPGNDHKGNTDNLTKSEILSEIMKAEDCEAKVNLITKYVDHFTSKEFDALSKMVVEELQTSLDNVDVNGNRANSQPSKNPIQSADIISDGHTALSVEAPKDRGGDGNTFDKIDVSLHLKGELSDKVSTEVKQEDEWEPCVSHRKNEEYLSDEQSLSLEDSMEGDDPDYVTHDYPVPQLERPIREGGLSRLFNRRNKTASASPLAMYERMLSQELSNRADAYSSKKKKISTIRAMALWTGIALGANVIGIFAASAFIGPNIAQVVPLIVWIAFAFIGYKHTTAVSALVISLITMVYYSWDMIAGMLMNLALIPTGENPNADMLMMALAIFGAIATTALWTVSGNKENEEAS